MAEQPGASPSDGTKPSVAFSEKKRKRGAKKGKGRGRAAAKKKARKGEKNDAVSRDEDDEKEGGGEK